MAVYSIARLISGTTISTACYELRTASTDRARILRWDTNIQSSATATFGLGRPGAIGVTPTSPVAWLAHNPADPAGTVLTALAWGTGPTAPTNFFILETFTLSSVRSQFQFPVPLVVGVSNSIVVWNVTATTAAIMTFVGEE